MSLGDFLSLEWLRASRPKCSHCKDERDAEVLMDAGQTWHPSLVAYVDSWSCPECGHQVVRGEDSTIMTPSGERL